MSNQLLPCPFCGNDEPTHDEGDQSAWVQCTNLECGMCGPIASGPSLAATAWNRRAIQPAAGEPVAWMYDTPNNGRQYSDKRLDHYWWDALNDSYVKGVPLYIAPPAAAPVAGGEPLASGVNYADEVDLIRAVLEGYSPSIARSDAICSVKLLAAYFAAQPAAAHGALPSLAGICRVDDHPHGVLLILRSSPTEDDLRAIQQALRGDAAAHGDEAVRKDAEAWQPLTRAGQVQAGDRISFTVAGKEVVTIAHEVLNPGNPDLEEVVYHKSKNHYFITRMAIEGMSSAKDVRFIAMRAQGDGVRHDD